MARGFLQSLGFKGVVPSPTFQMVEIYELADFTLWHFDLYRLQKPSDIYELGIEEAFTTGVSLIEWPERLLHSINIASGSNNYLNIKFELINDYRRLRIEGSDKWADFITKPFEQ